MNSLIKLVWAWPLAVVIMIIDVFAGIIPGVVLRLLGLKKIADSWLAFTGTAASYFVLFLAGADIVVSGEENLKEAWKLRKQGQRICLMANHTSVMDIPLVYATWRKGCGFVLKKEMASVPYVNLRALVMKSIFLDRGSLKSAKKAIEKAKKHSAKGYNLLVFPEGTRSKTGEIGQFKRGAFRFASESKSYIVPITIKGIRDLFEDRKRFFMTGKCMIDFGRPVKPEYDVARTELADAEKAIEKSIVDTYKSFR